MVKSQEKLYSGIYPLDKENLQLLEFLNYFYSEFSSHEIRELFFTQEGKWDKKSYISIKKYSDIQLN